MADVPAYFLTWTTYGSWLPGDDRGSVQRDQTQFGTPLLEPNLAREQSAKERLKSPSVVLSAEQRKLVSKSIQEVCAYKRWKLIAVNCRTNHVHVLVVAADVKPELVLNILKVWASRALNQIDRRSTPWWTRHGSTRWLFDEQAVEDARTYIENQ